MAKRVQMIHAGRFAKYSFQGVKVALSVNLTNRPSSMADSPRSAGVCDQLKSGTVPLRYMA